jgi:hypothetical protein
MNTLNSIRSRPFYFSLSILMAIIVVLGFWATYFGPLLGGSLAKPTRVHLHAIIYIGWIFLFITQVFFAAIGKINWHRRLGQFGIGYGILLVLMGLYTTVAEAALENIDFFGPFLDMLIFALFFAPAIYFRKKPYLHRKLMIVATTMLLIAAAGRMWFLPLLPNFVQQPIFFFIWFLPVILAIGYDYWGKQKVHPIYILGLICFVIRIYSPAFVQETETWIMVKEAAISAYLAI